MLGQFVRYVGNGQKTGLLGGNPLIPQNDTTVAHPTTEKSSPVVKKNET